MNVLAVGISPTKSSISKNSFNKNNYAMTNHGIADSFSKSAISFGSKLGVSSKLAKNIRKSVSYFLEKPYNNQAIKRVLGSIEQVNNNETMKLFEPILKLDYKKYDELTYTYPISFSKIYIKRIQAELNFNKIYSAIINKIKEKQLGESLNLFFEKNSLIDIRPEEVELERPGLLISLFSKENEMKLIDAIGELGNEHHTEALLKFIKTIHTPEDQLRYDKIKQIITKKGSKNTRNLLISYHYDPKELKKIRSTTSSSTYSSHGSTYITDLRTIFRPGF